MEHFTKCYVLMADRRTVTAAIEAAYRCTELFERRRRLMDGWVPHLAGESRDREGRIDPSQDRATRASRRELAITAKG